MARPVYRGGMIARVRAHCLLCESCGYELTGLDPSGSCPECDRPVSASLPGNRVGSPWQRSGGVGGWVRSFVAIARRPMGSWNVVRLDVPSSDRLTTVNLLVSSAMVGVGLASFAAAHDAVEGRQLGEWASVFLAATASAYFILLVCVSIESIGIQLLGKRHGWRIDAVAASTIVGHASYGWVVGALVFFCVGPLSGLAREFDALVAAFSGVSIVAAVVGLLSFETLVFVGLRRLRFANSDEALTARARGGP